MMINKGGRPNEGLSEKKLLLGITMEMYAQVKAAARAEGVPMTKWIRQAIEAKLHKAPWLNMETRGDVDMKKVSDALQAFHNRGGK